MLLIVRADAHAGGAADGEKGKKDPEYKAKADAPKSAWTKPNAQVGNNHHIVIPHSDAFNGCSMKRGCGQSRPPAVRVPFSLQCVRFKQEDDPDLLCCTAKGATGLTLAARLNQQALLPDMMFPTVNRFNPDNGQPLPTSNGKLPPPFVASLYPLNHTG